jgi:hypothetical protein
MNCTLKPQVSCRVKLVASVFGYLYTLHENALDEIVCIVTTCFDNTGRNEFTSASGDI